MIQLGLDREPAMTGLAPKVILHEVMKLPMIDAPMRRYVRTKARHTASTKKVGCGARLSRGSITGSGHVLNQVLKEAKCAKAANRTA